MRRIWKHPEISDDETTVSWLGDGQLEDTPHFREWLEKEFPAGASEMADSKEAETSRRSFLKLMGASSALAGFGMASCRRPESYILPYADAPEWVVPGTATYYASSFPRMHGATPLVVTSYEGRPTKLAPNDRHPDAAGTDSFAQASVLDLYSPNRSKVILKKGEPVERKEFEEVFAKIAKDKSAKIGLVFGRDDSPTRARLLAELKKKFPHAKAYGYEAVEGENIGLFGDGVEYVADFAVADRILSLDCDFTTIDPVGPVTPFLDRRKPEGKAYKNKPDAAALNRLYMAETVFSLTGGMADHRLRVKPSEIFGVAAELLRALGGSVDGAPTVSGKTREWVAAMAKDLRANEGRSMVVVGSRQPKAVHLLAAQINQSLKAVGEGKPLQAVRTDATGLGKLADLISDLNSGAVEHVFLMTPSNPAYDAPVDSGFSAALGKAKTSVHLGERTDATAHAVDWHVPAAHYLETWGDTRTSNGVYTIVQPMILPLYDDCVGQLEILIGLLSDEGTLVTSQSLAAAAKHGEEEEPSPALGEVRKTFAGIADDSEKSWKTLLREGFWAGSAYAAVSPQATIPLADALKELPEGGDLEVVFATDHSVYDGRWIDNGWLQEAPDPLAKVSWDNVALIAPQTAKDLGIYNKIVGVEEPHTRSPEDGEGERRKGRLILIKVDEEAITIPVQIGFGQAEGTIYLPLGYGQGFDKHDELKRDTRNQAHVGNVGINTGFNVYPLRRSTGLYYTALSSTPELTGQKYSLASVQEHYAMYGRALAREISTATDEVKGDFQKQISTVKKQGVDSHMPGNVAFYQPKDRDGKPVMSDKSHQWGMTIDLSSCFGCNACLVACQAENNIPIVGKEQVAMGREMHWIRMDRYFSHQKDDEAGDYLELVPQPVACQQCEFAPCETVCPVNATVHTEDGLNAMVYNRCIGTRYCANNCPYKARRFNFFDYNKRNPLLHKNLYKGPLGKKQVGTAAHLQRNPNVSVRMRGVMEKCTYCVQRLNAAVITQKRRAKEESLKSGNSVDTEIDAKKLRIAVDSVKVACQEACPADAISFGNLLDGDDSRMVRVKELDRSYELLKYIGTRPRTSYVARVKNPNPDMPGAKFMGKATIHMS